MAETVVDEAAGVPVAADVIEDAAGAVEDRVVVAGAIEDVADRAAEDTRTSCHVSHA